MSEPDAREAIVRQLAKKTVVYRPLGLEDVRPPRELTFLTSGGSRLSMSLYLPASRPGTSVPVVLLPLAYPDPEGRVSAFGPLTSWARLCAASGMAAAVHAAEAPEEDARAALRDLQRQQASHGLDLTRLGLLATSANVTVALSLLMRGERARCAALLYGYTLDLDGSTTVADMSRQAGFVDACAGRSIDDLPAEVAILVVRAGQDHFAGLNDALDRVIARALARNLPLTLINHPAGGHAFDVDEDTDASRGIIRQVLAFLRFHLVESRCRGAT